MKFTPFHERLAPMNETHLWSHWSGYLWAEKYQIAEKFEYFAIRNAAALIDTSPLYKYSIVGHDAEKFLAGVLARDIRTCRDGQAQYTFWCDDRGFVIEDGVILRKHRDEFLLSAAEPNLAYLRDLIGYDRVEITDVSADMGALAVQGPRSRGILAALDPVVDELKYFQHAEAKIGGAAVTISRTGYTGDLGFEVWTQRDDADAVFDAIWEASRGHGVIPAGGQAMLMSRIEAGLVLIDTDFHSSRYAFTDHDAVTPHELGFGWMLKGVAETDRNFIGRRAIRTAIADNTARWKQVGLLIDWRAWDELHRANGLIAPKDEPPTLYEMMLYDDDGNRVGFTTSFMYSPMLQRHIALARVRPELGTLGSVVNLEVTVNHQYHTVPAVVSKTPLFNPARKTA